MNESLGVRTYIPEPKRKARWKWAARSKAQRVAVTGNRRRVRGARSKKLQRLRSELTERTFAHVCETGGARRCWLHGLLKVSKRYLLQVAARNLSLIMRKLFGIGTPRSMQGAAALAGVLHLIISAARFVVYALYQPPAGNQPLITSLSPRLQQSRTSSPQPAFSTGC